MIDELKQFVDAKTKKVRYSSFISTILGSHIKIQDRIMAPVVEAFKQADTDNDGIILTD